MLGDRESDWETAGWSSSSDDERPPPSLSGVLAPVLLSIGVAGALIISIVVVLFIAMAAVLVLSIGALFANLGTDPGPCEDPERPLWAAAAEGDLEVLAVELEAPASVDAEAMGHTPLLCAAIAGQVASIELLLDAGADPDRDVEGTTALHQAVEHQQVEVISALADAGADLEVRNEQGATPLVLSSIRGEAEAVEALLAAGSDPTTVCQVDGSEVGSIHLALFVLASDSEDLTPGQGAVEPLAPLDRGRGPVTALHAAALAGEPETVRLLLQAGADPDAVAYGAYTPLHAIAARRALRLTAAELASSQGVRATDDHEQIEDLEQMEALLLLGGADPTLAPDPTVGAPADLATALRSVGEG